MNIYCLLVIWVFGAAHVQSVFFNSFPIERNINAYARLFRVLKFQFLGRNSEDAYNLRRAQNNNVSRELFIAYYIQISLSVYI